MKRTIAATMAVLVVLMGAYVKGAHDGRASMQAAHDAAKVEAQAAQSKAHAAEQSRRRGALILEDAANADPVAVPSCLSVDRVRRLSLR